MGQITLNVTPAHSTDPTPPAVLDFLELLAEAAYEADRVAKAAKDRADELKADLKMALEQAGKLNPDTKGIGVIRTIIKPSVRFDASLAKQLLTPAEVEKYSVKALDSKLVKANVTPDSYALMQKSFGYSLELKVSD